MPNRLILADKKECNVNTKVLTPVRRSSSFDSKNTDNYIDFLKMTF